MEIDCSKVVLSVGVIGGSGIGVCIGRDGDTKRLKRTHRSDPASGRGSGHGAAGLPQSVSEHHDVGSER